MKEMKIWGILTSSLDGEYYIIDNSTEINLFILAALLHDKKESDCANRIRSYIMKNREKKQKLFVDKKSYFGEVLSRLIQENELRDESKLITRENLVNALIQEFQKEEQDEVYLEMISSMIRGKITGNIRELCSEYSEVYLEKVVREGKKQDYLPVLNMDWNDQEEEGYLYEEEDGQWYQFDAMTKSKALLTESKKVKKRKLFEIGKGK